LLLFLQKKKNLLFLKKKKQKNFIPRGIIGSLSMSGTVWFRGVLSQTLTWRAAVVSG
jgi:hypothetical protein